TAGETAAMAGGAATTAPEAAATAAAGAATGAGAEESVRHIPELPVDAHPALFAGRTNGFVDFSEDVSAKDLRAAVAEGFRGAELAKRFTPATMGPVQGKLETVNTVAVVAAATGATIAETGTTTWRPPYAPVTLGALAGRAFEPVRYSPMQPWHEAHGAGPLVAGAWIRPDRYRDAAAEAAGRLRGGGGGGGERPRARRHHRRHPDRQAGPARARRAQAARPAVRQQVVQAGDRPGPLRRHVRRGRRGARRRGDRPARRGALPDEHHLLGRGHDLGMGRELAADRAPGLAGARGRRGPPPPPPARGRAPHPPPA